MSAIQPVAGAWRVALFLLAALALTACGTVETGVGAECKTGNDCDPAATNACITTWPGGYCTEALCDVGSCAKGARCVRGVVFLDVPFDAFCLATCQAQDDCRAGYRCANLSMPEDVCVPQNP